MNDGENLKEPAASLINFDEKINIAKTIIKNLSGGTVTTKKNYGRIC